MSFIYNSLFWFPVHCITTLYWNSYLLSRIMNRIVLDLQNYKLVCDCFIDASRRYKTLESKTKDFYYLWPKQQLELHICLCQAPFPQVPYGFIKGPMREASTCSGIALQERNTALGEFPDFNWVGANLLSVQGKAQPHPWRLFVAN